MVRTAVYAGSFDPITRGHEDLIKRSLQFVDRIVVAVATNVSKQPLFTLEERVAFIRSAVGDPGTNVVDKGSTTRDIVAAPQGDGQDAKTTAK